MQNGIHRSLPKTDMADFRRDLLDQASNDGVGLDIQVVDNSDGTVNISWHVLAPGTPTQQGGQPALSGAGRGVFPDEVIAAAKKSHEKWRVPASVTLAQWAVESNWGNALPPGSNNPFGIKAAEGQPFVECDTHEVIAGQRVTIKARFRRFDSLDDAFDQHGRLIATATPYRHAMQLCDDPDAFADALTGVYATDPDYGMVLKRVMHQYNLTSYD
jgi:flagellum-specific peptidoglycan hydrolase FlgJ